MSNIVIIHRGNQRYFKTILKQALKTNKSNTIVVIGDTFDRSIKKVEFHNIEEYKPDFNKVYKHFSTNPYNYELFCFERWFILKEYMIKNNLDHIFACDSDVMLYDNLSNKDAQFKDVIAAYCLCENQDNYKWSASAHISYWTLEGILKFCDCIVEYYTTDKINILLEKWNYHKENNKPGGICDMTLLYMFYIENKEKINNLSVVSNDSVFDDNINTSENFFKNEYEMNTKKNIKKIFYIKKKPFCKNLLLGKNINFKVLHFQGSAKKYLDSLYSITPLFYRVINKFKNKLFKKNQ